MIPRTKHIYTSKKPVDHFVFSDPQIVAGENLDHIVWAAKYCFDNKIKRIVFLGDWWDLPSECSYTRGQKSQEGQRLCHDIKAGIDAMKLFMQIIEDGKAAAAKGHKKGRGYNPDYFFIMGNHEFRIIKLIENKPFLEGTFGYESFKLSELGITWCAFEEHMIIDGILYKHYVTRSTSTIPVTKAPAILNLTRMSTICGHTPGLSYAVGDISPIGHAPQAIVTGSYYRHDESYRHKMSNGHWRGCVHLKYVIDGAFSPVFLSIDYLEHLYGG